MKLRVLMAASAVASTCLAGSVQAADPVNGKLIYQSGKSGLPGCSACHGADPANGTNNVAAGKDWTVIKSAITSNRGGMGVYAAVLTDTDLQDIAAYIANPASGTPSPQASLAPSSLAFGNQTLGIVSTVRSATLSNAGTAALTVQNITIGGANTSDFARTGTCAIGTNLNAGASCTIDVTFTPLATGGRSATISIAHNASGSPTALALSGTGAAPATSAPGVTLNPIALDFGTVTSAMSSAAKTAQLTNSGNAPLLLTDVVLEGTNAADFARTTDCPLTGSLAAGTSCSISVTFTPAASGARSADIAIVSNATGAPTLKLTGSGAAVTQPPGPVPGAALTLSATAIDFGTQTIGRAGRTRTLVVANAGSTAVSIASVTISGDFSQRNHCTGHALQPGNTCSVRIRFSPGAAGARSGQLSITSNATGSPHVVGLSGIGQTRSSAATRGGERGDDCDDDDGTAACSVMTAPLGGTAAPRRN